MSMMTRRGTASVGPAPIAAAAPAEPCFPEASNAALVAVPAAELRHRLESLMSQGLSGYLWIERPAGARGGQSAGAVLLCGGRPIHAWADGAHDEAALRRLLSAGAGPDLSCTVHALSEKEVLALAATFQAPQLTQPFGTDSGEVALLLRDLAGVGHSGTVHLGAGGRDASWVRILMHEGKFLGVYSAGSRRLQPSLAEVSAVLAGESPHLTLFAAVGVPAALTLPAEPAPVSAEPAIPGATPARDELLETDLIWFLSRFERGFSRLKERKDPHADMLRVLGELTNELATFVAALQNSTTGAGTTAAQVVAGELDRARQGGAIGLDLKLGKAGIDPGALAKAYGAQPRRGYAATEYFRVASDALLLLIERLLGRMLGAFYDAAAAQLSREGCDTLLREVRGGLAEMTAALA